MPSTATASPAIQPIILMNQPSLPKETWEEVVQKMITAYKAPISPQDVTRDR